MSRHPSDFLLDRHALGEDLPEVQAHTLSCERCAAHVAGIRSDPGPVPIDILRRTRSRRWRAPIAGGLALAAAILITLLATRPDPVQPKGRPDVTVWTQTADGPQLWDGEPLEAGDRVRLWVDPGAHRMVTVQSDERLLYEGEVDGPGPLPVSWTLDDDGEEALFEVRLSGGEGEADDFQIAIPRRAP